jgi:hypothetical protein
VRRINAARRTIFDDLAKLEDHGIRAYVQVNPCSGNDWVATVKADPRYRREYQAAADAIVADLRQRYALKGGL